MRVIPWENGKKWENGTKGLKFAKSVFFLTILRKKALQPGLKTSFFFWSSFWLCFGPKKGSIYKHICKIAKNSRN
jgi:hypothetical protein